MAVKKCYTEHHQTRDGRTVQRFVRIQNTTLLRGLGRTKIERNFEESLGTVARGSFVCRCMMIYWSAVCGPKLFHLSAVQGEVIRFRHSCNRARRPFTAIANEPYSGQKWDLAHGLRILHPFSFVRRYIETGHSVQGSRGPGVISRNHGLAILTLEPPDIQGCRGLCKLP